MKRALLLSLPFALAVIALLLSGRTAMLRDPGTFWHVSVGQLILDTGAMPRADVFTYTRTGQPWIAQQWLSEVVMCVIHRIGQWDAILLAACTLLAATYAAAYARLLRAGLDRMPAVLIVSVVVAASSHHFLARPHLITIGLSYWLYAGLCDWDALACPRGRQWLLPVVMVVWSNCHGGALGGVATVGLFGMCQWLEHRRRPPAFTMRDYLILGLCLIAPLINPYGIDLPPAWLALMRSDVLPKVMVEHAAPTLGDTGFWFVAALAAGYVGLLLSVPRSLRRWIWVIPLAWAVLAFSRVRHGPIFAIMTVPAIAGMYPVSRWRDWLEATRQAAGLSPVAPGISLSNPHERPPIALAAVITLSLGLLGQSARWPIPLLGTGWATHDPTYWPVAALPTLRRIASPHGPTPRLFNEMLFGGFVIHELRPSLVFIDDRCELHGDAGLLDYMALQRDPSPLHDRLNSDGVAAALVRSGSTFDQSFSQWSDWRCDYRDAVAAIYTPHPHRLAESNGTMP